MRKFTKYPNSYVFATKDVDSYQHNGVTIYVNNADGSCYIYTKPKGEGRVDFSTTEEAQEYIDNK